MQSDDIELYKWFITDKNADKEMLKDDMVFEIKRDHLFMLIQIK